MEESRRQAYLRAMGIDTYVLRSLADSDADSAPAPAVPVTGQPVPQRQIEDQPRLSRPEEPGPHQEPARPAAAPEAADVPDGDAMGSDSGATASPVRIALQFYRINPLLAVVAEVPYLGNERLTDRRRSLLTAILTALEVSDARPDSPEVFRWPLGGDAGDVHTDRSAALQTLDGFLRKRLAADGPRYLLVFAEQCESLFAGAGFDSGAEFASKPEIHFISSLDAMLQVPTLKRAVWDQLKSLRGRLQP